ncbi:MAG TPA: TraR/DksA C4-type zinc finger protein [Myxococcaceae bacterium]|nr:TraR/DksA C4-type zinc finger protein [Myxococcaceae bacterium]
MNVIDAQAREILMNRRRAIRRLIAESEAGEKMRNPEAESDLLDRALAEEDAIILHRLTEGERRELAEIDAALERIAVGAYGLCAACGGPIGRQRLRAIPEARQCIGCSEVVVRAS